MLRLSTMLLPTGEFAVVLSGAEVAGIDDAGLQAFTRFKEAAGATAGLAVPHEIEIENALVDELARRIIPEKFEDLGYVDGATHDEHRRIPGSCWDEDVVDGVSHDQHAIPPSFVGEAGDRDAYVGTLDGASTAVTGQLVASTDGWDSGDRLIETDLGPIQDRINQSLEKLQEAGLWPAGFDEAWEVHRDGRLISRVAPNGDLFLAGRLETVTVPRACPCYPALDGGQGEEARLQDEACVAEFGRCDDCPTLQP